MAQQAIHKFILGTKELEGKNAEFQYDRGWYSITDVVGESRNVIYKSRNAQEAYMKWNVYIGRKKERPHNESQQRGEYAENRQREGQPKKEISEKRPRNEGQPRSERQEKRPRRESAARGEAERQQNARPESRSRRENRSRSEGRQRGGANRRRYESQAGGNAEE